MSRLDGSTENKVAKIVTFGCQMNERDAETIAGFLAAAGYEISYDCQVPDLVIFITCCVRENAENRAFGNLGEMKNLKERYPKLLVGICGCMVQEEENLRYIREKMPWIDLVFGTHNIHRLPELISRVDSGERVIEVFDEAKGVEEGMPALRKSSLKAYVNIMYGCDNFCTYCIVPYVRGRERSRGVEAVLDECRELTREGFREITLLGQNVNSYGKGLFSGAEGLAKVDFAYLLERVNDVEGIGRIRFATSHPRDFTDRLIDVMASLEKVCHHIHLPVQAGNDRVLHEMNRGYTGEKYLQLLDRIRSAMPDVAITSDIMVGFPGETEEEFLDTMELVRLAKFDSAFTFIYSPREGTVAAKMEDQIPEEVKRDRIRRLIDLQSSIALEKNLEHIGQTFEVMVEGPSEKDENVLAGRSRQNKMVHWRPKSLRKPGDIVQVKVDDAHAWTLFGSEI